jgi:hypothetical protein
MPQAQLARTMSMMENRGVLRSPAASPGTIPAISVSTLLAPLFDAPARARRGIVLSVYGSAVNVVIDGALVTVAGARAGGLPNGVLVADPFDPRSLGVRAGMAVAVRKGDLTIDDGRVRISLTAARRWGPELRPMVSPPDLAVRTGIARRAVAARSGGLHGIVPAADAFAALGEAFALGSEAVIVLTGRGLVGLGAGLTPAGDDVLVGLTAGLTALGDGRARGFAGAWARHAIGRTTLVAETFHRHAAAGAYSERLHDVLRAILAGPLDAIPAAVATAAAWGATSGADTLAGILLALDPPLAGAELGAA